MLYNTSLYIEQGLYTVTGWRPGSVYRETEKHIAGRPVLVACVKQIISGTHQVILPATDWLPC
jgi:hypothetical protein